MGQLAEGDGRIGVERGGGRTRRGRGSGGQRWPGGHSPVRGRPLRAERSRRRSPWRGQAGVLASWRRGGPPGPASTPNGAPTTGRRDVRASGARAGGRRVSCRLRAIHPVSMRIHQYLRVYRDMYICVYVCRDRSIDRCTVTTVRCRTPAHGTGCIYISPRVRCCTRSRQVQMSRDIGAWPAVLVTGTPSLRWGRPSRG